MADVVVFNNTECGTKIFLRGSLYCKTYNQDKITSIIFKFREHGLRIKTF